MQRVGVIPTHVIQIIPSNIEDEIQSILTIYVYDQYSSLLFFDYVHLSPLLFLKPKSQPVNRNFLLD